MRTLFALLLLFILCLGTSAGHAQDAAAQARQALQRLAATYRQPGPVSFDVLFRYAEPATPTRYLDTLRGQFRLQAPRYWCRLDDQVSVYDGQVLLTIFPEDRLLHLSQPASPTLPGNAVSLPDSFLLQYPADRYTYTATSTEETVQLSLPAGGPCRQITWVIDRATGYLRRTESLVRADQLYAPAEQPLVRDAASVYVHVEALYQHGQPASFPAGLFDLQQYVRKEGQAYVPLGDYAGYQVFMASPALRR